MLTGDGPEEVFEHVRGEFADRGQPIQVHLLQGVLRGMERHRPAGAAGVLLAEEDVGDPAGMEDVVVAPRKEAAHRYARAVADALDALAQGLRAADTYLQPATARPDAIHAAHPGEAVPLGGV